MKHIIIIFLVFFTTATFVAQENPFIKDYLERLENSKKYTLYQFKL